MGIKSYQAPKVSPKDLAEQPSLKVSDYMRTNMITFKPDQTLEEVITVLIKERISGAPVVNDKNELVGIISEGDCLKQISKSNYYNMPLTNRNVENCMTTPVTIIDGNMSVFDAINMFLNERRRQFPIVKDKKLVGLLSQKNILKALRTIDVKNK